MDEFRIDLVWTDICRTELEVSRRSPVPPKVTSHAPFARTVDRRCYRTLLEISEASSNYGTVQ